MGPLMPRAQRRTLLVLSFLALILAATWGINETWEIASSVKMEPLVVVVASAIPILSLWWPFNPKFSSKRKSGKVTVDLGLRNTCEIGDGETLFKPYFSSNSPTSAHLITRHEPDLIGARILAGVNRFSEVSDAAAYELGNADISPAVNDIVLLKNRYGNYALLSIRNVLKFGSTYTLEVEYVLAPDQIRNFS
ncbi:hypothetical protein I6F07_19485 [Ensifer sp. IC4062]|nr:hypothetical protein [Ensifer sp. IC4062]MCA1442358.1 hypothetical protein [Ensifer sp. IC4062]